MALAKRNWTELQEGNTGGTGPMRTFNYNDHSLVLISAEIL